MTTWTTVIAASLVLTSCSSAIAPSEDAVRTVVEPTSTSIPDQQLASPVDPASPVDSAPLIDTNEPVAIVVATGADQLVASDFGILAGKRVGLISHQNSTVGGAHLADLIHEADQVELVAMFGPEHGARGDKDAGEYVEDFVDPSTGVPVFSLFGPTRQPTPEMLADLDVLVYDLQDVGARYFTYVSTMGLAMQAAARSNVAFVVLDRPNPLGGRVSGGVLDPELASFVGQYPVSDIYGLTAGELAIAIVANRWLDDIARLDLEVVPMRGWNRSMYWVDTGLQWTAPSPAMTTPDAALLFPITVYLEATSMSYGRGTDQPFQRFGAPWLDADRLVADLRALDLGGIGFEVSMMTPEMLPGMVVEPAYLGETIPSVDLTITDPKQLDADALAMIVLDQLFRQASEAEVDVLERPEWLDQLSGSTTLREELESETPVAEIIARRAEEAAALATKLEGYHLYPTG